MKERKKYKMIALYEGTYTFTYKDVDFIIVIETCADPVLSNQSGEITYKMTIDINDEHEEHLYSFIEEAKETVQDEINLLGMTNKKTIRKYIYEMDGSYGEWTVLNVAKKRTVDTLFLEKKVIDNIKAEVQSFICEATKEEYAKYGIPYKYNMLLYGLPGTGKTTTITCIASLINSDIAILQLTKEITDINLTRAINSMSKLSNCKVLVLEDIDSIFSDERKVHDSTKNNITMSGLLNFLDGLMRNEGIIVCITTNNKEVLDKAIFRSGRIDLQVPYTYCKEEQVAQMLVHYFPDYLEQLKDFYEKVQYIEFTVADLQAFFFKYRKSPLDILKHYKEITSSKKDEDPSALKNMYN